MSYYRCHMCGRLTRATVTAKRATVECDGCGRKLRMTRCAMTVEERVRAIREGAK